MKSKDGVKKSSLESYKAGYKNRIAKVIERLESQLKKGTKPFEGKEVSLTDTDVKRIEKELKTIKSR